MLQHTCWFSTFDGESDMTTKSKADKAATATEISAEEQIRIAAYYNWEKSTGGSPVDEDTTRRFWLEAEEQMCQKPEEDADR